MSNNKFKTYTRVLEEFSYVSTIWRVIEKVRRSIAKDTVESEYVDYRVEVSHNSEGSYVTQSFPISHPDALHQMIVALQRVEKNMLGRPSGRRLMGRNDRPIYREIEDGLRVEEVWSPYVIVNQYETNSTLLGHNHINPDSGKIVRFEPHMGESCQRGSGSSSMEWTEAEIGLTVEEAHRRRGLNYSISEDGNISVDV